MEDQLSDFGRLFEARDRLRTTIRTGEKVSGKVILVGRDTVFVDLGARADGVMDKNDFADGKGGFDVHEGDEVEAFCMGWTNEGIKLQRKIAGRQVDSSIEDAYAARIPIEGRVTAERKGGYTVAVAGAEAFCPFSQIDARGVRKEPAEYLGQDLLFLVTEYSEGGRNIVLGRRALLEAEAARKAQHLKETLQEGDVVEGTVVKLMPFGAFVDLGGVEGMVHVSEIGWSRGIRPEDVLQEGQPVRVKVLSLQWGGQGQRDRISLSIKAAEDDPWTEAPERYPAGTRLRGKVTRLADFGCFIELEPGVEGLAHISRLGAGRRIAHPSEVVREGEEVEVTVLGVDAGRRRISLCIGEPPEPQDAQAAAQALEEEQAAARALVAGQTVEGEIEQQRPFGLFVRLPSGQTGLLHISQIPLAEGGIPVRTLYRQYPLHGRINVIVKDVQGSRISLTTPEAVEKELEQERQTPLDVKDAAGDSFGSFGDLLDKLKL